MSGLNNKYKVRAKVKVKEQIKIIPSKKILNCFPINKNSVNKIKEAWDSKDGHPTRDTY